MTPRHRLHFDREKANPQELCQTRGRAERAVLLAPQLDSFTAFLQAAVPPKRRTKGCRRVHFDFPDRDHSKNARLEFVSFALGEPPFDVKECQQRGHCQPAARRVRLTIMDKEASKPTIRK
jgi:DNA-directed RNA polymerase subunit beta